MQQARLMRSESDKMLAGVCGGLADYLNVDPVLVRLAFVVLLLASGIGLAIYALLWIILPTPSRAQPVIRVMDESVGEAFSHRIWSSSHPRIMMPEGIRTCAWRQCCRRRRAISSFPAKNAVTRGWA